MKNTLSYESRKDCIIPSLRPIGTRFINTHPSFRHKTKKRVASLSSVLLILFSCTQQVEEEAEATLTLTGTSEQIEVGAGRNQVPISFSTNLSWSAASDVQWISLSSTKGSAGDAAIVATVDENQDDKARSGAVTIKAGKLSKTVRINQSQAASTQEGTLIIKVSGIDHSSYAVSITSNSQKTYFYDVVEKTVWDKEGGEAVWKSKMKKDAIQSGNSSKKYTDQKTWTQFIAFAAFCDKDGNKEGIFVTEEFITDTDLGGDDPTPISFSVSNVTETSFTLTTSSSSQEKYFYDIVKKSTWDQYGAQAVWKAYVDAYIQEGTFVALLASGESSYDFTELDAQEYVAFAAYCYNDGTLKGTIYHREINLADFGSNPVLYDVVVSTSLLMVPGEESTLTARGYSDSVIGAVESPKVKWKSNNPSIATVDQTGHVKAVGVGRTSITITAINGGVSDDCYVFVVPSMSVFEEPLDLGLSVKWGQHNIGTNRPEGFGQYYTWGATEPWTASKETYPYWSTASLWDAHKDEAVDAEYSLYRTKDPARQLVGKNWHLPTKKEFEELVENCSMEYIKLNGRIGVLFTSKKAGYSDKWLFLPHTGGCWTWYYANAETDEYTLYWSSTINPYAIYGDWPYENAWSLELFRNGSGEPFLNCDGRRNGNPLRPVYSDKLYFDVIVSDITNSQCVLTIGTNSTNIYYVNFVKKSTWDSFGEEDVWKAYVKLEMDAGTFVNRLESGDNTYQLTDLSANTEYVVFAAFCNQNGMRNGQIYSRTFKTN